MCCLLALEQYTVGNHRQDPGLSGNEQGQPFIPPMPLVRAATARGNPGTGFSDAITGAWAARGISTGVKNNASALFFTLLFP